MNMTTNLNAEANLDAALESQSDGSSLHHIGEMTQAEAISYIQEYRRNHGPESLHNLAPLAFAVAVDPRFSVDDSQTLTERCVEVTPVVHPLMDARLVSLGMTRLGARTYSIGVGEESSINALLEILKTLDPFYIETSKTAEKFHKNGAGTSASTYNIGGMIQNTPLGRQLTNQNIMQALNNAGAGNYYRRNTQAVTDHRYKEHSMIAVSCSNTQMYLKFMSCYNRDRSFESTQEPFTGYEYDPQLRRQVRVERMRDIPVQSKGFFLWKDSPNFNLLRFKDVLDPIRMTPAMAVASVSQLENLGFEVVGAENIADWTREIPNKIIAERIPASPGMGQIVIGSNVLARASQRSLHGILGALQAPTDGNADLAPYKAAETTAIKIHRIIERLKSSRARISEDDIVIDEYLTDIVAMVSPSKRSYRNLRPYQNEMVNLHLATRIGAVNACSPGTGKTPTTLTGFREKARKTPGYRAIAVVPASVRSQWIEEAEIWFKDGLDGAEVRNFTPAQLRKSYAEWMLDLEDRPGLVVLSYQQAAAGLDQLVMYDYHDIVCDEAAILANKSTGRTKALWELRKYCETAIATTGTPIGSSLDSLGSIVSWTRNERDAFDGNRLSKRYDMTREGDDKKLIEALGPVLFRRDASVIRDQMPEIENSVILLDPHSSEKKLADGARDELKAIIELLNERKEFIAEFSPGSEEFLEASSELRKIQGALLGGVTIARKAASDPEALVDSESAGVEILKASGLLDKAIRNGGTKRKYVEDLTVDFVGAGEAVLIFSDFITVAKKLVEGLEARGMRVGTWFGDNTKKREEDKRKFMDGELDVMVLTGAGREGLNLQRASALIHYDLPWVPTQVIQRVGRAARFGSTATHLKVVSPVMRGTIEERVASVLVPRAVEALIALDRHRGVKGSETDIGQAIGGLNDAISDETRERSDQKGLIDLANEVLGS